MKVAIYGRTNGQNDIEEQVEKCRDYAQQNNLEIAHEFIDDLDTDGKSFEQLLEAAAEFESVVMQDRARLSRNALERETRLKALREAGLDVCFVSGA